MTLQQMNNPIMVVVDDLDAVLARLCPHGAEIIAEIAQDENFY